MLDAVKTAALCALAMLVTACAGAEPHTRTSAPTNSESERPYADAIAHFARLPPQNPGAIEGVLGLARNLRWAGRAPDAARVLKNAAHRFGSDGGYHAELGKVYLALGESEKGVVHLRHAMARLGDNWQLSSALGIGLDLQGNHRAAQAAYRQALELCPNNTAVMNNLGLSQAFSGQVDRAILTLTQALALTPHRENIALNLARLKTARDLCPSCDARSLKQSGSRILATDMRAMDWTQPCVPKSIHGREQATIATRLRQEPSINIKVYFEFDSATLKPEALEALNDLGAALSSKHLRTERFQIAGHTDAVGSPTYNLDLSIRRAKAVRDYLVAQFGIDPQRIETVGYGASRLLTPTSPKADINRRVQVTRLGPMAP